MNYDCPVCVHATVCSKRKQFEEEVELIEGRINHVNYAESPETKIELARVNITCKFFKNKLLYGISEESK